MNEEIKILENYYKEILLLKNRIRIDLSSTGLSASALLMSIKNLYNEVKYLDYNIDIFNKYYLFNIILIISLATLIDININDIKQKNVEISNLFDKVDLLEESGYPKQLLKKQ